MTEVTCAVISNDEGLVLAVRRGPGMSNAGKWEFPGGKTRPGEGYEECILREIDEELGMEIVICGELSVVEHDYGDRQIRLIPFICHTLSDEPLLHEHDSYRWMAPDRLTTLDLSAADIPVAEQYAAGRHDCLTGDGTAEEAGSNAPLARHDTGDLAKTLSVIKNTAAITMVARSALAETGLLDQLVELSLDGREEVAFRASWALSKIADLNIRALQPWLPSLIAALPGIGNLSVQRAFLRIVMLAGPEALSPSHHPALADHAMAVVSNRAMPAAPRVYAMEILRGFCRLYPEMTNEVVAAIELATAEGSGAIRNAGRKMVRRLTEESEGEK